MEKQRLLPHTRCEKMRKFEITATRPKIAPIYSLRARRRKEMGQGKGPEINPTIQSKTWLPIRPHPSIWVRQ